MKAPQPRNDVSSADKWSRRIISEYLPLESDKIIDDSRDYIYRGDPLRVSEDPKFRNKAEQFQWRDREKHGYPKRTCIFDFIGAVYAPWLGRGMTQADLRKADFSAYRQMHLKMDREGLDTPKGLDLPTLAEANLQAARDAGTEDALLRHREAVRKHDEKKRYSGSYPSNQPECDVG